MEKLDVRRKIVADRIVPAKRFKLAAGAPSKVLKAVPSSLRKRVFKNASVVAHPVLRSVALARRGKKTPLPVVSEEDTALFEDRYDESVRWYLPDFEVIDPGEAGALFTCEQHVATDRAGEDVIRVEGAVSFAFRRVMNEAAKAKLEALKEEAPDLTAKEIPLAIKEAKLILQYWDSEEGVEVEELTGTFDQEKNRATFRLKDAHLKIAYARLSRNEGVELKLIGDYDGWERAEEAMAEEATLEEEATSDAPSRPVTKVPSRRGVRARVRDHRRKVEARIRDHRRKVNVRVRDHRKTRDHRRTKVRDHRRKKTKVRARRGKKAKVRDHRTEEAFAKQRYIFEKSFHAMYPCEDYLQQYRLIEDEAPRSFGCAPPWSDDFERGKRYKKITLKDSDVPATVYESLAAPDTFLVVPDRYVITREEEDASPAVAMTSSIDPEGGLENDVTFEFAVAPDLSTFEQMLLCQRLYEHTSRLDGSAQPPIIELPSDLPGVATVAFEDDRFFELVNSEPDGDNVLLTLRCHPLQHALTVIARLQEKNSYLLGSLNFDIDDGVPESSTIKLDLNETVGPALQVAVDATGGATLTNACESRIRLEEYLLYASGKEGFSRRPFPEALELAPGEQHLLTIWTGEEVAPDLAVAYDVLEDTSLSLSERRIDVSEWEGTLVIDAAIDPARHDVSSIQVEVKFEAIEKVTTCTLAATEDGFEPELVDFFLPLDQYLAPGSRTIQYRVTVTFGSNGSPDKQTDWIVHDLGANPTLTIRRDVLG